ncbi:hypothetical protein Bbelb_101780 [Branchiostoma belcheri]|nr:hypothetical protein Bbelb_101780 [Branchiostoma belcheri]
MHRDSGTHRYGSLASGPSNFNVPVRFTDSYYWDTPTGRRHLNSSTDAISVKDSGVYTFVADKGKRSSTNRDNTNPSSATLHVGVQAMVACVHAVPNIANYRIKEELDPNSFPLRRFQLVETPLTVTGEARYRPQRTALTTQADIHQYSNDDTPGHSADTEEGQDHHYAPASAPDLPVCDGEDNSSPGATGPDPLQAVPESDEEERPYGIAAANSAYEDTNLYQNEIVSDNHNPAPRYCAVNANHNEPTPSMSRNSLYGRHPENMTTACDSTSTMEDLGILYGNCPATDE